MDIPWACHLSHGVPRLSCCHSPGCCWRSLHSLSRLSPPPLQNVQLSPPPNISPTVLSPFQPIWQSLSIRGRGGGYKTHRECTHKAHPRPFPLNVLSIASTFPAALLADGLVVRCVVALVGGRGIRRPPLYTLFTIPIGRSRQPPLLGKWQDRHPRSCYPSLL